MRKKVKTYNSRDSLIVAFLTTSYYHAHMEHPRKGVFSAKERFKAFASLVIVTLISTIDISIAWS
jgi:hypothetical protein